MKQFGHAIRAPTVKEKGAISKAGDARHLLKIMAEGVGFEPTVEFPPLRFSRPVH